MLSEKPLRYENAEIIMRKRFLPGVDVLLGKHTDWLKNKQIGLVSHLPAVNIDGITSAERIRNESGGRLAALFGPEHGFLNTGNAGKPIPNRRHPYWRIPVYSLYGKNRKPTAAMFKNLDVIIMDIQDIGARPYTYVSTLRFVLERADELNKPVIIADRPIPLPRVIDGPMLDPAFECFVGCVRTPMSYGMTPGEIALWLKADIGLTLDLRIARMQGYMRQPYREPNWPPWLPPSPGIRSWEAAACYLATVFTEALPSIDNGRSSNLAFQLIGAAWMKSKSVCERLSDMALPGVAFYPHPFQSSTHAHSDLVLDGMRIVMRNPTIFRPVLTSIAIIFCLQTLYGINKVWKGARKDFFDKLYGTDSVRKALMDGDNPRQVQRRWIFHQRAFRHTRKSFLLYGWSTQAQSDKGTSLRPVDIA